MLEWATYDGNFYGTPKQTVEKMLSEGKNVILEIDVQGAFNVKKIFPETVLIFVLPPSMEELKKRLIERGREGTESIQNRMEVAKQELELAAQYNYVIINDDLDKCVEEVREFIKETEDKIEKELHRLVQLLAYLSYCGNLESRWLMSSRIASSVETSTLPQPSVFISKLRA